MSISKKKDSPFYYVRFTYNGVRVQESTKTTKRAEAKEYEQRRLEEVKAQFLQSSKPSYSWFEAEKRWLEEMRHKRTIVQDIEKFEWLGERLRNYSLNEITVDVIETLAKEKEKDNVSNATVNRLLALIRSVLTRACKQWEWLDKIPYIRLRKEPAGRIRWLTDQEAKRLLGQLPIHLKHMTMFTLFTGLRASNVKKLKWENINFKNKTLIIHANESKTGKTFSIPLNSVALTVLEAQKRLHSTYVFVYKNKPIKQCNTRAWRQALKRAGIEGFRWHDLRHTWASWHVQNGTSLQELQQLGGWASFDMVLRYAHLDSSNLEQAANKIICQGEPA